MNRIKNLVNVVAISFGLAFLDGMFELGFNDNVYLLIGAVDLVAIVWLLILVHKKKDGI